MKKREFKDPIVTCLSCGKVVERVNNRQWWCSRNCGEKFKRAIKSKEKAINPKYIRTCEYCGAEFKTNLKRKVFCTIRHKELYHNKKQGELGLRQEYRDISRLKFLNGYDNRCCLCGHKPKNAKQLVIHHLAGDGHGTSLTNIEMDVDSDNLMVLCRRCHNMFHGLSLIFDGKEWQIKGRILSKINLHCIVKTINAVDEKTNKPIISGGYSQ